MGERELVIAPRRATVDRAEALSTRLLGEGAGEVDHARSGQAGDDHVLVLFDPAVGG